MKWIKTNIAVVVTLLWIAAFCLSVALSGIISISGRIDDPTERGLFYVAIAIVAHALFGGRGK